VKTRALSLRAYLLFGLLVRIPAVFFSRGYDFLDHQFQYVDPAYHLALGGSWWRPHDYVQGLRPWVYPGLLALVFRAIAAFGYYLRRPRVDAVFIPRTSLFSWLRANAPGTPWYVLAVREPLDRFEPPPPYLLEPAGEFRSRPDWQRNAAVFSTAWCNDPDPPMGPWSPLGLFHYCLTDE
jgi:hypothetical protein